MKVCEVLNFAMGAHLIIVQFSLHRPVYFLEAAPHWLGERQEIFLWQVDIFFFF